MGAASWDQLVALENLPHAHTHTPLLCYRLPLQEQRQRADVCALHGSAGESSGDGDQHHLLVFPPGENENENEQELE